MSAEDIVELISSNIKTEIVLHITCLKFIMFLLFIMAEVYEKVSEKAVRQSSSDEIFRIH